MLQEEIRNNIEVSDPAMATVVHLAYMEVSLVRYLLECKVRKNN